MWWNSKALVRITLAALLAVALAVPAVAGALPTAASVSPAGVGTDDDIPDAVSLLPSPVTGSLHYLSDTDDVFAVNLTQGQVLTARLTGAPNTEYGLALFAPGATSVFVDYPVAESFEESYPQLLSQSPEGTFGYVVPSTGIYYLDVYAITGSGDYALEWAAGVEPTLSFGYSKTITFGRSTDLTGSVLATSGAGVVGQRVELFAQYYPWSDNEMKKVASTETTTGGAYKFTVSPSRYTRYITVASTGGAPGHAFAESVLRYVKVRVDITAPKVTTKVYKNRTFKAYGYLKPKHTSAGAVYIYKYKKTKLSNGTYAYVYKSRTKANYYNSTSYPTKTKYAKSTTLPLRGKWKLVAKAMDDGKHVKTTSAPLYLTVY